VEAINIQRAASISMLLQHKDGSAYSLRGWPGYMGAQSFIDCSMNGQSSQQSCEAAPYICPAEIQNDKFAELLVAGFVVEADSQSKSESTCLLWISHPDCHGNSLVMTGREAPRLCCMLHSSGPSEQGV
jgi:hypothetical protein